MRLFEKRKGYDSIEVMRDRAVVNGRSFGYDDALGCVLEPIIARIQTRTRNARFDLEHLEHASLVDRALLFWDELSVSLVVSRPYRESIDRASGLKRAGSFIETRGVPIGGSLAWYAGIEERIHEQVYAVRFGVEPVRTITRLVE